MDEVSARSLRNVITVLMEQRGVVMASGASFAAHLIDLAIMQLRLTIHDISEEDYTAVDDGMTECSRWIRGHDQAPADGTPFPAPPDLTKRIDDLDGWVKGIRRRRERKMSD